MPCSRGPVNISNLHFQLAKGDLRFLRALLGWGWPMFRAFERSTLIETILTFSTSGCGPRHAKVDKGPLWTASSQASERQHFQAWTSKHLDLLHGF